MIRLLAIGLTACACSLGCGGGTPDKAAIEKKIRDGLAQKTEWKDVTFEMKLDGKLTTAGAHREIDGQKYWFNFTGGDGTGGVAVRKTDGTLLCKYLYEGSKETSAS
jgi:hypothetical protein